MTNKTYTAPGAPMSDAVLALYKTGALKPRVPQPSEALLAAQRDVSRLVASWDDALAARIAADNLFLDRTAERRSKEFRDLAARHGAHRSVGPVEAENALRGKWRITCERGWLDVTITLAPTSTPRVQYIDVRSVLPPSPEMQKLLDTAVRLVAAWDQSAFDAVAAPSLDAAQVKRQVAAAAAWGACAPGEIVAGDGSKEASMRMKCEKGSIVVRVSVDPSTHRISGLTIAPAPDERCVP
jgi:hypothetical protein